MCLRVSCSCVCSCLFGLFLFVRARSEYEVEAGQGGEPRHPCWFALWILSLTLRCMYVLSPSSGGSFGFCTYRAMHKLQWLSANLVLHRCASLHGWGWVCLALCERRYIPAGADRICICVSVRSDFSYWPALFLPSEKNSNNNRPLHICMYAHMYMCNSITTFALVFKCVYSGLVLQGIRTGM